MGVPSLILEDTPVPLVPWAFQRKPQLQIAVKFLLHMCDILTLTHVWCFDWWAHDAMTEKEKSLQCKISTDTVYITLKMHTAFAVDPHWKMSSVFRKGQSVNPIRDLSMSKHLWVNTGSPSSSCEMIILQNKSHGKIIRVCMGKFMTAFRNTKI